MADPLTMTAMAATAGGSIISAIGTGTSAAANAAAFRYKSGLALMNQRINKQNAEWAREAGDINAEESGIKSREEIGGTKAAQAGSGLDVNTGTGARVREDQGAVAAFDQGMIRYSAAKTAYGYEAKAAADEAESHMMDAAAENATRAGRLGILSSILGGASAVSSRWMQGRNIGLFNGGGSGGVDEAGNPV